MKLTKAKRRNARAGSEATMVVRVIEADDLLTTGNALASVCEYLADQTTKKPTDEIDAAIRWVRKWREVARGHRISPWPTNQN